MLIPSESDFDLAAKKLVKAGFRPAAWSYGIIDPHLLPDDEITQRSNINSIDIPGYWMLNNNPLRFQFPAGSSIPKRVVLLQSTYVGLSPLNNLLLMQRFYYNKNLYYSDKALLESFIRTLL